MASCPNCGQEVRRDFAFCPSCAADLRVHPQRPVVPPESRQRRISMVISVGIVLALITVALLVTTMSV